MMIDKFTKFLEAKGCRKTPERYAILKEVMQIEKHFDVEMLCDRMAKSEYPVSKATIYNNLELLVEFGLIRKEVFIDRAMYERCDSKVQHLHLVCTLCGRVKDERDLELVRYLNTKKFSAFITDYYTLNIYGTCNACARKMKRSAKAEGNTASDTTKNKKLLLTKHSKKEK
ncbi:MAG: Fur family transcriptional regulator [Muribaculaceae bacterium]